MKVQKNSQKFKNSEKFRKIQKNSEKFTKNSNKFKKIQKNSKKFTRVYTKNSELFPPRTTESSSRSDDNVVIKISHGIVVKMTTRIFTVQCRVQPARRSARLSINTRVSSSADFWGTISRKKKYSRFSSSACRKILRSGVYETQHHCMTRKITPLCQPSYQICSCRFLNRIPDRKKAGGGKSVLNLLFSSQKSSMVPNH